MQSESNLKKAFCLLSFHQSSKHHHLNTLPLEDARHTNTLFWGLFAGQINPKTCRHYCRHLWYKQKMFDPQNVDWHF